MAKTNKQQIVNISLTNVVAIVVLVVLVSVGGHFLGKHQQAKATANSGKVAAVQSFKYDGVDGKTALELLKEKATVNTQDSSIGTFVLSINGVANTDTYYWMFYVNGELSSVGADQYVTKAGDKIEWRYEAVQ